MSEIGPKFVECVCQLVREVFPSVLHAVASATREASSKADGSLVTETDWAVEEHFTSALERVFPDVPVLGEEMSVSAPEFADSDPRAYYARFMSSPYQIVIDPIDGTKNFVEGRREFCIAAALTKRITTGIWPLAGVVAVPNTGMMYYTRAGSVFEESVTGAGSTIIKRRETTEPIISASSTDRLWLSTQGFSLAHPWVSSGSSVYDFLGTALGRLRGSIAGVQRLWDLMAPLALGLNSGCVLRDLITGELVTEIAPSDLSPNLDRRPWGLERRMVLLPSDARLVDLVAGPT